MDFQFPPQLFPSYYHCGPPDSALKHCAGHWGSYQRLSPQIGPGPPSSWTFTPKHEVRGEQWRHTEPISVPLLTPKSAFLGPLMPPNPLDFSEHMHNFYIDHSRDAFKCMSDILGQDFNFGVEKREGSVNMWKMRNYLDKLKLKMCQQTYYSRTLNRYSELLSDVVPSVPPHLLGPLLYEELALQRDRMLFNEGATGGALAFVRFPRSSGSSSHGCLLYPGNQGHDLLHFHKVELQDDGDGDGAPCMDTSSSDPVSFQLKGPVRQLSCTSLLSQSFVGVRLDHLCGVWRLSEEQEPRLLQAIKTSKVATCISLSPHIVGEVLVASESGVADLWTVGRSVQTVRAEDRNLYFNAKSSWRWCEFSAHPRVVLYADRTGVELTDIRASPASSHTLFRISSASDCRTGERLILSRYLGDAHCFHHLITTQYSAYIMDERFPGVPMLKLDHMMQSPPVFCHVVAGSAGGESSSTKIFLGSHSAQEITLLQYSGGKAQACSGLGPPQALLTARESLKQLPVQIPHRFNTAVNRLSAPATGLTCIQSGPGGGPGQDFIQVLQLTEAGDIFCQVLQLGPQDSPQPAQLPAASQPVVADTSSDEEIIETTQAVSVQKFVAETPEREQQQQQEAATSLDFSSEDSNTNANHGNRSEVGGEEVEMITPVQLSEATLLTWKRWLQKLMGKSQERRQRPRSAQHFTVRTNRLLSRAANAAGDAAEAERVQRLRQEMKRCMSSRSLLLLDGASSGSEVIPVPDVAAAPADPLSRRLSLSWRGEEAWLSWWEEELGTNREAKVQALRRKRRREKEARRAAGQLAELSGSFSSSASCASELDDFSDWTGRSAASSQAAWSDAEDAGGGQRPLLATAAASRGSCPPGVLLWESQEDPPPSSRPSLQEQKPTDCPPPPSHSAFGSQSSVSRSSLGRQGSSQASQPKKKSRMGF